MIPKLLQIVETGLHLHAKLYFCTSTVPSSHWDNKIEEQRRRMDCRHLFLTMGSRGSSTGSAAFESSMETEERRAGGTATATAKVVARCVMRRPRVSTRACILCARLDSFTRQADGINSHRPAYHWSNRWRACIRWGGARRCGWGTTLPIPNIMGQSVGQAKVFIPPTCSSGLPQSNFSHSSISWCFRLRSWKRMA